MTDLQPWIAERDRPSSSTSAGNGGGGSNVDKVLFKNLVEIVPLVESLMDKRASLSFTRRASMVHTPAPQLRKAADLKSQKVAQTNSVKKQKDAELSVQNNTNELLFLQDQVTELQKTLLEKEKALKAAESLTNQVNASHASLGDLKLQVSERDSLIKSTNAQLYNAKIKLADKQAALEKLEWEAKMSNKKVEELQANVVSNELEISALMQLFEAIANSDSFACSHDFSFEPLPHLDDIKEMDVVKMEKARAAYMAAVAVAKEDPGEESLAAAAEARRKLQSFAF